MGHLINRNQRKLIQFKAFNIFEILLSRLLLKTKRITLLRSAHRCIHSNFSSFRKFAFCSVHYTYTQSTKIIWTLPQCRSSSPLFWRLLHGQRAKPNRELWGTHPNPCAANKKETGANQN